jgi:hypothetical protein
VYISFAAKWDRLFIGIDGVVESFHVPTKNIASGASSGHFFLIGGPNCPAGTYVDDIYCSMIPWSYDQDFTPPAYEWETEAVLSTRILVTSDIQTINYSDYVNAGRGGRPGEQVTLIDADPTVLSTLHYAVLSPAFANLWGVKLDGTKVITSAEDSSGSQRPTLGVLWPRD